METIPHETAVKPPRQTVPVGQICVDATLLFALFLFLFSPPWHIFSAWSRVPELGQTVEVRRAVSLLEQLEHPLAPVQDPIHRILQWRLLFPGVGHLLHVPPVVLLAMPYVGAVLAIGALLYFARRDGVGRPAAVCGAVLLGASGWFFASTGWLGYFDSWLVVAMLFTSHARSRGWVWLSCLLGPWIDERFIIALPLALATRWLRCRNVAEPGDAATQLESARIMWGAAALGVAFVVLRFSLAGGTESLGFAEYVSQQQTFRVGVGRHLLGAAAGLRFGWVLVAVAAVIIWQTQPRRFAWSLIGVLVATMTLSALIANDLSRSPSMLLPVALLGLVWATARGLAPLKILIPLSLAALALPAQHVVTDFTLPIDRLPTVLRARAEPAGTLSALNWVKRAEELVGLGDRVAAERHLDVALRLDAHCGAAYNVRGFLAYQQSEWQQAFANFARASQLTPAEPSFWLHQAYAAWKLGDTPAYTRAIAEAKRLAPAASDVATKIAALECLVNAR